jgi:hypothetical protein
VSTPTKPGGCVTMRLPVLFAQGHLVVQMGGQELTRTTVHVEFQGSAGCSLVLGLQGIQIPGAGDLEFRLRLPNMVDGVYTMRIFGPPAQLKEAPVRLSQLADAPVAPVGKPTRLESASMPNS